MVKRLSYDLLMFLAELQITMVLKLYKTNLMDNVEK